MRTALIAVATVAALVAGCSGGGGTISGELLSRAYAYIDEPTADEVAIATTGTRTCESSEFEPGDFDHGDRVVVLNGEGSIVGASRLETGIEIVEYSESLDVLYFQCLFTFEVDVSEAQFYTITVDDQLGPMYSADELDEAGWRISLG